MNIQIAGAGRVGFHLARLLCAGGQDVTVIDRNPQRREVVDFELDARTAVGDATSVLLLQSLGVDESDLFIACTGNDNVNLIAANAAKGLGAKQAVARVDNPEYIESRFLYEGFLGVDHLLSPDALTAHDIINYIENPGVLASEEFCRGKVQLRQLLAEAGRPADGRTVGEVFEAGSGVLAGVIGRAGDSIIPRGNTLIKAGDKVTLLGTKEKIAGAQRLFADSPEVKRVAIFGAGTIGKLIARALDNRSQTVKLFDKNAERCEDAARDFFHVKVVNRDTSSRVSLEQEHLGEYDVFVATTEDDERNIMAGVLAREVGVKHVAAVVHQPDFAPLVVKLGIDVAITPRSSFANSIQKIVHQNRVTASAFLGEGDVEVFELTLDEKSPVAGRQLKDIGGGVFDAALVANILRGNEVIVPSGYDTFQPGDGVVVVATTNNAESVRRFLQGRK